MVKLLPSHLGKILISRSRIFLPHLTAALRQVFARINIVAEDSWDIVRLVNHSSIAFKEKYHKSTRSVYLVFTRNI